MKLRRRTPLPFSFLTATLIAATLLPPTTARAGAKWDGSEPPQGVYFHWYEPSFYTGFAPRTQNPDRVHIRLSRGNQVRFTMVLGDDEIDHYLDDLFMRRRVYRELIDEGVIELTTNRQYEHFVERLEETGANDVGNRREELGDDRYRAESLRLLGELNPGRIFPVQWKLERLARDWHRHLIAAGDAKDDEVKLELTNAILPGRVNRHTMSTELDSALAAARKVAPGYPTDAESFALATELFLKLATRGNYVARDGLIRATEFTAIYPAGTVEARVKYKSWRLPAFGVTGVWPLIPREKGRGILGMVDYLSTNPGYGFIPMLPYEHAGGAFYNAFHNAGVRSPLADTPFLPKEWRRVKSERNPKKSYQNLWIVSRGPTSHGCTRLASGHMTELREALPATSERLERVDTFRNLPQCYDVFDIDADGRPEVMGVSYFLAYRSKKHLPVEAYAPNDREGFYRWLYGDNIHFESDGTATIRAATTCRFVGKKARERGTSKDVPLYEAPYEPDAIQFYRTKKVGFDTPRGFELNREIRKVGAGHAPDRKKLLLQ